MSLSPKLLATVEDFIRKSTQQILQKLKPRTIDELRAAMPFHALFFGDEGLIAAANQRSIVTSMGLSLYPGIAKIIVEHSYKDVFVSGRRKKNKQVIEGELPASVPTCINDILEALYTKKRQPDHRQEMEEILAAIREGARRQGKQQTVKVEPDLYIGDYQPGPLFIEFKSPYANKDVCFKSKNKLLTFLAMMHKKGTRGAQAYLGLTYNPDVEREAFNWWPVRQMMDMQEQVLIGQELWDKLGGTGTYAQLIRVVAKIRKEIAKNPKLCKPRRDAQKG